MRHLRHLLALLAALTMSACMLLPAAPPSRLPLLHLSPSDFGSSVSLSQRLTLINVKNAQAQKLSGERSLDSLLEINAEEVQMAGFAIGRRLLTLHWDGKTLNANQDRLLPWRADPERILRDIQLAFWPSAAIIATLPNGWTLEDSDTARTLYHHGLPEVHISFSGTPRWQGTTTLDNRAEGYLLKIESTIQAL